MRQHGEGKVVQGDEGEGRMMEDEGGMKEDEIA